MFYRIILTALLVTLAANDALAQTKIACDAPKAPGDTRVITCLIKTSPTPRSFRFKANFTGSHDDTTMSMIATLDGAELACGKGSKTTSQFEDGEVSLECRFPLAETTVARSLGVKLAWSHAQYTDFELVLE